MFRLAAAATAAGLFASTMPALAQYVPMPEPRPANLATAPARVAPPASILPSDNAQARAAPRAVQPSGPAIPVGQLSTAQRSAIARVNAYFNSVTLLHGSFIQIGPDGNRSEGKLFLKKPGKLRFEFAPPSKLQIISNGQSVALRDRALNTQDIYPLSQTPLRYLLQNDIDILRDTTVTGVYVEPDLISIALEETSRVAGTSRLLLTFDGSSHELKQWTITDAQGLDTTVMIYDLKTDVRLDDRLFAIDFTHDPSGDNR